MPHTTPKVPSGMHLLPELPTLLDVYASFGGRECVRLSPSLVQTLDIPEVQRDFLLWPGLPISDSIYDLNLNWHPEIHFCMEDGQKRFAELYRIFESSYDAIFLERFTGFLWSIENSNPPSFVASGLEEFFLLQFVCSGEYCDDTGDFKYEEIVEETEIMRDINDGSFLTYDESLLLSCMIDSRFHQSAYFSEF